MNASRSFSPHPTSLSYDAPDRRASFKSNRSRKSSWAASDPDNGVEFGEKSCGGDTEGRASSTRTSEQVRVLEDLIEKFGREEDVRLREIRMKRRSRVASAGVVLVL